MARLTALRWLAWTAAAGMFLVLVMGVTVTTTGSAEGCGRDWPLCHGRFVPDFAVATAIEFSHRAVTGVEGILIVALAVLAGAPPLEPRARPGGGAPPPGLPPPPAGAGGPGGGTPPPPPRAG